MFSLVVHTHLNTVCALCRVKAGQRTKEVDNKTYNKENWPSFITISFH